MYAKGQEAALDRSVLPSIIPGLAVVWVVSFAWIPTHWVSTFFFFLMLILLRD